MANKLASDGLKLLASVLICQAAGFIGSVFTNQSIQTWYPTLKKPAFNPPNWLFAPVWITLFLLMGIALFLVWRAGIQNHAVKNALIVFAVQLILNMSWSFLFFGLRSPVLGLIDIILLWIFILITIFSFSLVSSVSSILLLPYLLWVSFAAVLNFFLWRLNP